MIGHIGADIIEAGREGRDTSRDMCIAHVYKFTLRALSVLLLEL